MRFEEWLLETENYGSRLERFLNEWDNGMSESDIMKWMKAAYMMGLEHSENKVEEAFQTMLRNVPISSTEHRMINSEWAKWKDKE